MSHWRTRHALSSTHSSLFTFDRILTDHPRCSGHTFSLTLRYHTPKKRNTRHRHFLLITPSGQRVELRQVERQTPMKAADSSYMQLTDNSPNLLLRTTDGTQLSFLEIQNEFRCWQVKDRNGNYLTIASNALGRITNITDTLG